MGLFSLLFKKEKPKECDYCKCTNKILIGYHYSKYVNLGVKTYRNLACRDCKRTFVVCMASYVCDNSNDRESEIKKFRSYGYLNLEEMNQKIDTYKYTTKLVELENI